MPRCSASHCVSRCYSSSEAVPDEPLLHVALKSSGEQDAAYVYETVYASGKSRACNAFTPDACVFYTADYADFDTSALRSHRVNTLVATTLYDSVGNVVEPSETMIAMMHAAADQIDHAIFDFQIIVVNGQRYFAFVKLNVNWWDPCTLYEYEGGEPPRALSMGQYAPAVGRPHLKSI